MLTFVRVLTEQIEKHFSLLNLVFFVLNETKGAFLIWNKHIQLKEHFCSKKRTKTS